MIIDDVAKYIDANTTLALGTNLFKGFQPDSPADCVVIYDTGGATPDRDLPTGNPTFQILIRNTNYKDAHDRAKELADLLHRKMNLQLVTGGTYFYSIFLMGEPGNIGRDEKGRDEFSVNFVAHTRR